MAGVKRNEITLRHSAVVERPFTSMTARREQPPCRAHSVKIPAKQGCFDRPLFSLWDGLVRLREMPPRDHAAARPPKPEPVIPLRMRTRQMLADLSATARLVWSASPRLLSLILVLSILLALVPAATLWVGKLLLDEVARAIAGGFPNCRQTRIAALRRCSRCRSASPSARRSCRRFTPRRASCSATRCRTASACGSSTRPRRSTSKASRTPRPTTRCATRTTKSARGRSA